jgi:outer membrane receptor protein involved in Fe transport
VEYQVTVSPALSLRLDAGYWYERADRDIGSSFLETTSLGGSSQFYVAGLTPQQLGHATFEQIDRQADGRPAGMVDTTSDARREIQAWGAGSKATLWDDLDLLAGARFESLLIQSNNDPFTGGLNFDGTELTFPTKYLFFDRLDNPARGEVGRVPPPGTIFNDQVLGIDIPVDPVTGFVDLNDEELESLITGEIDEDRVLPSFGFTYRPIEGMNFRGAYSQTVARPSFREMGYYISVEPGSDDLILGNPS